METVEIPKTFADCFKFSIAKEKWIPTVTEELKPSPIQPSNYPVNPIKPRVEKKPKKCHICNKTFNKTYSLSRHMHLHTNIRPFKCPYPCSFAFIQKSDLKRHLATHSDIKKYVCLLENCGKQFRTKRNRHSHQINTHLKIGTHTCKVCHKQFRFLATLKLHNRKMHITGGSKFQCDWCGKFFLIKNYLRSHFKRHLAVGPSFKPKYHVNFVHKRYERHPPVDEEYLEEAEPVMAIEELEEKSEDTTSVGDQLEIEVTEMLLDPDMEIKEEALDESTIMYELCPMDGISGGIKEEAEDDDRDFLQSFIPHMKCMSLEEKKRFKRNARMIIKNIFSMKFRGME